MWSQFYFMFLSIFLDASFAANLFVSHYSGNVATLTLTPLAGGAYSLTQNSSLSIGGQPSWMTYNSSSRTIYVSDETGWGSGSITAVTAATNGGLRLLGRATAGTSAVANGLYGGGGYIANAHYGTSTISTFKLPLTSSSRALQTLKLTMTGRGTIPSRQDAPHPHAVFEDPTGEFLLVPDLGADQIRIYSINKATGILSSCPSYVEQGGTGPRHGVFWGANILYVGNELSNTVHAFSVSYPVSGCLTLTRTQTLTTLPGNRTAPAGSKVGEIHVEGNFLYVSNRRDLSFSPNDSIAAFSLDSTGVMTFQAITSSGGTYPRTFSINNAGDLIAIGDQTTANVVVVKRDPTTGTLGNQVANMRIGIVGTPENDNGLSAVLWDE